MNLIEMIKIFSYHYSETKLIMLRLDFNRFCSSAYLLKLDARRLKPAVPHARADSDEIESPSEDEELFLVNETARVYGLHLQRAVKQTSAQLSNQRNQRFNVVPM
jgi:hypothetical protein